MDRQRGSAGLMLLVGTIAIAAFLGWIGGASYGAAYGNADDILDAVGNFIGAFVIFALMSAVAGAVIGGSSVTWRWTGFALLVVTLSLAILLGFATSVGFFDEGSDFASEDAPSGVENVMAVVTLAGALGLGIGLVVRMAIHAGRPGGPAGAEWADKRPVIDLVVGTVVLVLAWVVALSVPGDVGGSETQTDWRPPATVEVVPIAWSPALEDGAGSWVWPDSVGCRHAGRSGPGSVEGFDRAACGGPR